MSIIYYFDTAESLYVKFDDSGNTCVEMVEGSDLNTSRYEATDESIADAGLEAGTYAPVVMRGDADSPTSTDDIVGVVLGEFNWNGSNEVGSDVESLAEMLLQIQGTGFDTSVHSLVRIARQVGISISDPEPPVPEPSTVDGVSVTEIFNNSSSQVSITYNSTTGPSVTSIRPTKNGTIYLLPTKRVTIETSRLIASQIQQYVAQNLIETYRRIVSTS